VEEVEESFVFVVELDFGVCEGRAEERKGAFDL
jgi:hypothetical protein